MSLFEVKIIRSHKRHKTVSAKLLGNVIEVRAPERMRERQLKEVIEEFKEKFKREQLRESLNKDQSLFRVAERLNKQYFDGKLQFRSIEYATNLKSVYGYCDLETKEIKLSHVIAKMPKWVRDYVIVHELAHLVEANHTKRFWKIVNQYPLTERARGFLIAKGLDEEERRGREDTSRRQEKTEQAEFDFINKSI